MTTQQPPFNRAVELMSFPSSLELPSYEQKRMLLLHIIDSALDITDDDISLMGEDSMIIHITPDATCHDSISTASVGSSSKNKDRGNHNGCTTNNGSVHSGHPSTVEQIMTAARTITSCPGDDTTSTPPSILGLFNMNERFH